MKIYKVVVGIILLGIGIVLFQNTYEKVLAYQTPAGQLVMAAFDEARTKFLFLFVLSIAGLVMVGGGIFNILQGLIPKVMENKRAEEITGIIIGLLMIFIIAKIYIGV